MLFAPTREFGWRPDLADPRDYSPSHEAVLGLFRRYKLRARKPSAIPEAVDGREYCGAIEDQGELGTSSAHAAVALVQQFERRSSGRMLATSRLFAHQAACRLQAAPGDGPIGLRSVLKAIVRCGIPPEKYWPYDAAHAQREPDPFTYSFTRGVRALRYVRLDSPGLTGDELLVRLRSMLAAGFPFAFGFPVFSSIGEAPEIAFPTAADDLRSGQAVVAVGYDDTLRIRSDKGALLVRNSWGRAWGDDGFGWLPYSYVTRRLAADFWTLLKPAWLRSGEFDMPSV